MTNSDYYEKGLEQELWERTCAPIPLYRYLSEGSYPTDRIKTEKEIASMMVFFNWIVQLNFKTPLYEDFRIQNGLLTIWGNKVNEMSSKCLDLVDSMIFDWENKNRSHIKEAFFKAHRDRRVHRLEVLQERNYNPVVIDALSYLRDRQAYKNQD